MKQAINVLSESIITLYLQQKLDNDDIFLILAKGITAVPRIEKEKEKVALLKALQNIVLSVLEQLKNNKNVSQRLKKYYYSFYYTLTALYNKFSKETEEILPIDYFNLSEKDFED